MIKKQRNQQYRQQLEENKKNHVQNKLNRMYDVIAPTLSESADSYIAYNVLSNDEDEPVSTEKKPIN